MTITEKFSCGAVSYVVKGGCNSWVYGWSFLITKSRLIFCYIWKKELDEQLKKKELVPIFRISTQCTLEAKRNNRKSLLNQKLSFLTVPPSSSFGLLFCRLTCNWYGMTIRKTFVEESRGETVRTKKGFRLSQAGSGLTYTWSMYHILQYMPILYFKWKDRSLFALWEKNYNFFTISYCRICGMFFGRTRHTKVQHFCVFVRIKWHYHIWDSMAAFYVTRWQTCSPNNR